MKVKVMPDEAAFYGPKIDVKLVDAIGRLWQLSTVQFDFTLPRRFDLEYVAEDGKRHQPLMVHRALYGSIERFFGILIEHYAGAFPVWLAPVQAVVLPITDRQAEYAQKVVEQLGSRRFARRARRSQREGEPQDPRSAVAENSLHAGGGRSRGAGRAAFRCATASTAIRERRKWKSFWPASSGSSTPKPGRSECRLSRSSLLACWRARSRIAWWW